MSDKRCAHCGYDKPVVHMPDGRWFCDWACFEARRAAEQPSKRS